jgi:hypothetical protein
MFLRNSSAETLLHPGIDSTSFWAWSIPFSRLIWVPSRPIPSGPTHVKASQISSSTTNATLRP